MNRRQVIYTLSLGVVALGSPPAIAQDVGRTFRLGGLHDNPRQSFQVNALFDELSRLGFTEGRNLVVDARGYGARSEQFPILAAEMVKAGVDALTSAGPSATRAAQEATRSIPILAIVDDMLAAGLVQSLARPSGNVTGISILAAELDGKRQDILLELVPGAKHIGALADPNSTGTQRLDILRDAARKRGVALSVHFVDGADRIGPAIEEAKRENAGGLNVLSSPFLNERRAAIFEQATAARLPAVYQWAENAEEGGLASYGPRNEQIYRQLAHQLAAVWRGAKVGYVPVTQPARFELVINLRAARSIGAAIPTSLLLRADKVIE